MRTSRSCGLPVSRGCRCLRGEARPDSDIDLLAAFDEARNLSLLDVIRIENQIADLLGRAVDLIEEGTLKPHVRQSMERETLCAFYYLCTEVSTGCGPR